MKTTDRYNGETLAMLITDEIATTIFIIEEGTGDNLLDEDIDSGYIDYVNWTSYDLKIDDTLPIFVEADGGMVLTKEYVCDMTVNDICKAVCGECGADNKTFITFDACELTL